MLYYRIEIVKLKPFREAILLRLPGYDNADLLSCYLNNLSKVASQKSYIIAPLTLNSICREKVNEGYCFYMYLLPTDKIGRRIFNFPKRITMDMVSGTLNRGCISTLFIDRKFKDRNFIFNLEVEYSREVLIPGDIITNQEAIKLIEKFMPENIIVR